MGMQKVGKWTGYGNMLTNAARNVKKKGDQILAKAAVKLASDIKVNLTSGGNFAGEPFDALDAKTIAKKGSSAPLLDKGDLLRSVVAKKISSEPITFLVGIPGDADSKDGKTSVVVYAAAHEFGAIIKKGKNKGKVIKKRAFIGPTVEFTRDDIMEKMDKDFKKIFEF